MRVAESRDQFMQLLADVGTDVGIVGEPDQQDEAALTDLLDRCSARCLVLADRPTDEYALSLLRRGFAGCVSLDVSSERLLGAVLGASRGRSVLEIPLDQSVVPALGTQRRLALLTARQKDVLALLAQGRSNAEIARQLHISVATVKTHVANIFVALEVRSRTQLVGLNTGIS